MLPKKRIKHLSAFNSIIACSEHVENHLKNIGIDVRKLHVIPVIQEKLSVKEFPIKSIESKHNIKNSKFILYVGAIKKEKGIDILLDVYKKTKKDLDGIDLVLVGPLKTQSSKIITALRSPNINHIGTLDREEILYLMKIARICVNFSRNEGMPRVSLEALSLGKPCLLPLCVPEFKRYCSKYVISSYNPDDIAKDLINVLNKNEKINCYPIYRHYPEHVLTKFTQLLKS
jgi:glycosyltransferase involved in cell wall biosynthesis